MSEAHDDPEIFWVDPDLRGILPLDGLHISKSLRKVLRQDKFSVTCNTCFSRVIEACAQPRPGQNDDQDVINGTWINVEIIRAYGEMHALGLAHSVEVWKDGDLAGGLYGIHLKGAFMGESMFSRTPNASKVALAHLVARLRLGGFALLDTQFLTPHLARMGGIEISGQDYIERLERALEVEAQFPVAPSVGDLSGTLEMIFSQSKTQTS